MVEIPPRIEFVYYFSLDGPGSESSAWLEPLIETHSCIRRFRRFAGRQHLSIELHTGSSTVLLRFRRDIERFSKSTVLERMVVVATPVPPSLRLVSGGNTEGPHLPSSLLSRGAPDGGVRYLLLFVQRSAGPLPLSTILRGILPGLSARLVFGAWDLEITTGPIQPTVAALLARTIERRSNRVLDCIESLVILESVEIGGPADDGTGAVRDKHVE